MTCRLGMLRGFLAFARALRTPTIYNAISRAKRLDGVARYGFPESVRRHFERLDVFPAGFFPWRRPLQSRLWPGHERGRAGGVPAQEAARETGEDSDPITGLAPAFFAEMQALIETPWSVAMLDFAFPETRGQRPADLRRRSNSASP